MASPLTAIAAPTRQDVIITFSVTSIDTSGGATLNPDATSPSISNTYAIANIFNILDAWLTADLLLPDRILNNNMTAWIENLQITSPVTDLSYGGFRPDPNAPNATLTASYFATQALDRLNTTESTDEALLIDFVVNLQRINGTIYPETVGAFLDTINSSATVSATYFGIQTLETYNAITQMNESLAIVWLNSSQFLSDQNSPSYGGFVNGRNSTTADLQTTYMALRSLEILNSLNTINQTAVIEYILPHYRSNSNYPQYYGGFSLTPASPVATHWATYYAVAALLILGADDQLSSPDITSWILSTQTRDGGFADMTGATGFVPQTNLAVSTLAMLDQLPTLLQPISSDLYVFPWWIVGIVIIIIVVVLFVICARRSEWF